jgi:rod shape-determining protein MreC
MRREGIFQSSKLFWVALSFAMLFFLSSFLPKGFFFPMRFVFQTITTPFENVVSAVGFFFRDMSGTLFSIGELKQENIRLRDENMQWRADEAMLLDIRKENEELRKELALPLRKRFEIRVATVIAKDSVERGKWVVIDTGSFDGVKKGMAVVATPGVIIGVVDEVYPKSSRVMLLSHPESAIPGRIAGQNTRGIAKGEHALGMMLGMISQTDTIHEGDSVVTDDLERNIPSGLLIGTIQSLQPSLDHLFLEASIIAPFRLESLRFVSVLLSEHDAP